MIDEIQIGISRRLSSLSSIVHSVHVRPRSLSSAVGCTRRKRAWLRAWRVCTVWRNSHFRTKKTQAAVQRLLWLRTGPMSPCAQSKWLRNSRYMSMTDSDGYLAISRNHTLTRPAQLFFFGVCAPGRFSWLQSLGRTQVAPRGGADGAGTPARTATSTSTCQTCLWDGL